MCSIYCCGLKNKWMKKFSYQGLMKPCPSPCHSVCLSYPPISDGNYVCVPYWDSGFEGYCWVWVFGQMWMPHWMHLSPALCASEYVCSESMTVVYGCVMALVYYMSNYVHICGSINWYAHMPCVIICMYGCIYNYKYLSWILCSCVQTLELYTGMYDYSVDDYVNICDCEIVKIQS